ncbi:uncharacterized protein PHALS_14316 [Plasmopara halstedii]|uniref:Uncharacterized protein n=1 Tax=Plasmopara halstedii TaxID=4781 RepID=A0A0P1ARM2_PLAHL|nr:uncharacterized protein PHALS_14316 [Plasmopara halstedii]CEG44046.1 hypothetical protein PHALS_14316 [Plasmopara halstedii]|eukprot:XP_024580415.1 hypothetical protein PHALS_14316 [Plasmopara halstedii]
MNQAEREMGAVSKQMEHSTSAARVVVNNLPQLGRTGLELYNQMLWYVKLSLSASVATSYKLMNGEMQYFSRFC